ncbi:MAG: pyridoxal phosphate-dependent aminotransferase family protein [Spirochaetales bacterium]|nr:pyridoxal phosphate-dependent aminotransferase family protein [Spirochaetales bacterium]
MDLFEKCDTDAGYFGPYRHAGDTYLTRPVLDPQPGNRMLFRGKQHIMWSVNNYIGLAGNEEVRQVALDAVKEFSVSAPMGSRMMSGNTEHHLALERDLSAMAGKEAAFLFNYGYLGVIGTIASLVGPDDTVVMDKLSHASIIDGVLLAKASGAKMRVFRHNDAENLEMVLKRESRDTKGGILVVGEGVYGMTGDLANLPAITEVCQKYGARIFVDDAHGWGVMGKEGRGTADYFGVQDKLDIYFATFAKAYASIGGFAASAKKVVDWIAYNARTQVFAKSLPMVYVKSLHKTLELVKAGEDARKKMWENSKKLKEGIRALDYFVGEGASPICAVFTPSGDEEEGARMVGYLREKGIFVTAVIYPVIPRGLIMFRMIPTAAHTDEDINTTIKVFAEMRNDLALKLPVSQEGMANIRRAYGA